MPQEDAPLIHPRISRRKVLAWILVSCSPMIAIGCSRVPQVLQDEAAFGELDALYTAVTTKRTDLLKDCQQRITRLHDEKRMSDAGYEEIQAITSLAEEGEWSPAAERLYTFMRAQRKVK